MFTLLFSFTSVQITMVLTVYNMWRIEIFAATFAFAAFQVHLSMILYS